MAGTLVSDIIVPSIFVPYVQQMSAEKSRLIQSGAVVTSDKIAELLNGGGLTFNVPSWKDLAQTTSLQADDAAGNATPTNITTTQEIAVRISRSQGWGASDLSAALAGEDPLIRIADLVATYWSRQLQRAFVSAITGLFADNAAAPTGSDTHVQNDLTFDIKGVSFSAGVTDFNANAFIDAQQTMGDSAQDLAMVCMHSVVFSKAKKNNLIDFIPDARGEVRIPTFLGLEVIVDDAMPVTSGVYDTWLFGTGAVQFAQIAPKTPVETIRRPEAANGSGTEELWSRTEFTIHPTGHAYIQSSMPNGGPTNTNLAAAANWSRRWPERKQIKIARLITREA